MTNDEIKQLKHIVGKVYYKKYKTALIDDDVPGKMYYPVAIDANFLYDYSKTAEHYISSTIITTKTLSNHFVSIDDALTKLFSLNTLTLDQAQAIIDRNSYLFNKINAIAQENELIEQVNACS